MKQTQIAKIAEIARLQFEAEQSKRLPIVRKEAAIRQELNRLRKVKFDTSTTQEEMNALRSFGGEVAWMALVDRKIRALNTELAHVKIAKLETDRSLSVLGARLDAFRRIQSTQAENQRRQAARREDDRLFNLFTL